MKNVTRFLLGCAVFVGLAVTSVSPVPGHERTRDAQTPDPHSPTNRPAQVIAVTTKDFTFVPPVIHVKVNAKFELDVTASDQPVGIRVSPFPDGAKANTPPGLSFLFGEDCYKIKKNETVPILLEATEPGTYTFSCCKGCGSSHKSMQGRIIVDPAP